MVLRIHIVFCLMGKIYHRISMPSGPAMAEEKRNLNMGRVKKNYLTGKWECVVGFLGLGNIGLAYWLWEQICVGDKRQQRRKVYYWFYLYYWLCWRGRQQGLKMFVCCCSTLDQHTVLNTSFYTFNWSASEGIRTPTVRTGI